MRLAYLDNSATTPVSDHAARTALHMMQEAFGNPSSVHGLGLQAEREMVHARGVLANALHAAPDEIFFTSGGTEANNLAVLGGALANRRAGRTVITTAVEHPSVLRACEELSRQGFEIVYLPVGADGRIRLADLEAALNPDTVLVSVMLVNNETGADQPVAAIREMLQRRQSRALLHTDCVQAFGKQPVDVRRLGADLVSVSGHKVHAPKGVGALYVKKGVRILPQTFGGGQENGMRSGTPAVPSICAFAAAVADLPPVEQAVAAADALRRRLLDALAAYDDVVCNSPADGSPFILNVSVPGIPSEVMIRFLEEQGVYVSGGSACAKGGRSHVLAAQGLPARVIDSALRISFSHTTSAQDVAQFAAAFDLARHTLHRKRG